MTQKQTHRRADTRGGCPGPAIWQERRGGDCFCARVPVGLPQGVTLRTRPHSPGPASGVLFSACVSLRIKRVYTLCILILSLSHTFPEINARWGSQVVNPATARKVSGDWEGGS